MSEIDPRKFDLSLLEVFDMIMTEGSLTRAGEQLGMTQSAVSHCLRRLRAITGDGLFERSRNGVAPTERARRMAPEIKLAMDQLRSALNRRARFDPITDQRTFVLDLPVGFDAVVLPPLLDLAKSMSGLRFRILNGRATDFQAELRLGETWLAMDYVKVPGPGYRSEQVFDGDFLVFGRRNHPALQAPVTAKTYAGLKHIALSWSRSSGLSPLDQRLSTRGLRRDTIIYVPLLSTIPAVIRDNDLVATAPAPIARAVASWFGLATQPLAFELDRLPIYMVWHEGFLNDAGHIWLRQTIKSICRSI